MDVLLCPHASDELGVYLTGLGHTRCVSPSDLATPQRDEAEIT